MHAFFFLLGVLAQVAQVVADFAQKGLPSGRISREYRSEDRLVAM
jgi:hypothetical protein